MLIAIVPIYSLCRRQYLFSVSGHRDLGPDLRNPLVGTDQESRPDDAHELPPVHRLLLPDAVGLEHAMCFVRTERDGEFVLGLELILRRHRDGGDAKDFRSGFAERSLEPRKIDGLLGATGRVGARIEVEHELAPGKIGKRDRSAAVAGQGDLGALAPGRSSPVMCLPFDAFAGAFWLDYACG